MGKLTKIKKPILGETLAASKSAVSITVVFAGTSTITWIKKEKLRGIFFWFHLSPVKVFV
jgi:hypothetical protein